MVDALTDIAASFNWSYIVVLHSHNSMGDGMAMFKKLATSKGLCIKHSFKVNRASNAAHFKRVLKPLTLDKRLQVMFLLLDDREAKALFSYIHMDYDSFKHVHFVSGQRLGTKLDIFEINSTVGLGVLSIEVESPPVRGFEEYYTNLNVRNNSRNTFFKSFWEETFNCTVASNATNGGKVCTGLEKLHQGSGFYDNAPVLPVINAVLAIAHALRQALAIRCSALGGPNRTICLHASLTEDNLQTQPYINDDVIRYLPSVHFNQPTDDHKEFKFQKNYRLKANYFVYNTQLRNGNLQYQKIGMWIDRNVTLPPQLAFQQRLELNVSLIKWREGHTPVALCSNECAKGQVKSFDTHLSCCWTCVTCSKNAIIKNNTCKSCGLGTWPGIARSSCNIMPTLSIDASSTFSVVLVFFSTSFILMTLAILVIHVRNYESKVIKATSRELSLVIQSGLLVVFMTSLVFLAKPSSLVCNTQQALFGVGFVLCSAPLFLKTITIYRIIHKASTSVVSPKLVKSRSKLLICFGLVFIQFLLGALWLQGNPAMVTKFIPSGQLHVVTHCKFDTFGLAINFFYPTCLMLLATLFALRTRNMNVPRLCNEARNIASSQTLTCLVLFIYLISFSVYSNNKDRFIQEYSISVAFLLVGAINVIGLFVPRLIHLYCPSPDLHIDRTRNSTILSEAAFSPGESTPVQNIRRFQIAHEDFPKVAELAGKRHVSFFDRSAKVSPEICRERSATLN